MRDALFAAMVAALFPWSAGGQTSGISTDLPARYYPSVAVALDAEFPDDHHDYLNSAYLSAADRAARAARLAIVETMLLDEVMQLVEIDAACRALGERGSSQYRDCAEEYYTLPTLLVTYGVPHDCDASLALPDRAACLLLAEAEVRKRRHTMQWHPAHDHALFEQVKGLIVRWRDTGQPDAAVWGSFPEAMEIARLDSLALYVHALDLAVSVQAVEIFRELVALDDRYIIPDWGAPQILEIARANRLSGVQNAKNRMVRYWRLDPPIGLGGADQARWVTSYRRWLFASRFGAGEAGMAEVGAEGFHFPPPPEMAQAELAAIAVPATAPLPDSATKQAETERPIIWVRNAVPIRIPPPLIPARDVETTDPLPRVMPEPSPPQAPPERVEGIPGYGLPNVSLPPVFVPTSARDCVRRWRSECHQVSRGKLVTAFYGKFLEDRLTWVSEKLGPAPTVLSAAVPDKKAPGKLREGVRFVGKKAGALLSGALCILRAGNDDIIGAFAACASMVPGPGLILSLNPNLERDLPGLRRAFERAKQEALAQSKLMAADENLAGQRDYERHFVATDYLRSLGAAEPESGH